eukprot:CAMPEP_0185349350 /NCGR_PEP_ID=MMETSP1364-20130426/2265_1 /TAXON_ID=38817 /ORGANISM="Gephyrocapsa oceanica, Strain RCC1303" /LENGTH=67 /DNA_ID=CAMNT_0027948841 /DNA_START=76 /DNA_END=276 /DNA_ORIENTATION=+
MADSRRESPRVAESRRHWARVGEIGRDWARVGEVRSGLSNETPRGLFQGACTRDESRRISANLGESR